MGHGLAGGHNGRRGRCSSRRRRLVHENEKLFAFHALLSYSVVPHFAFVSHGLAFPSPVSLLSFSLSFIWRRMGKERTSFGNVLRRQAWASGLARPWRPVQAGWGLFRGRCASALSAAVWRAAVSGAGQRKDPLARLAGGLARRTGGMAEQPRVCLSAALCSAAPVRD